MIKVTLKDGSVREFENELSVMDIAKSISEGLARAVVAASVNGKVVGLNHIVKEDCELNLFKFDDEEGKDVFRHTSAHILAQAIKRLYPEAKFAIGPTVENGFYYDIDLDHRLTNEDLEKLEKEMKKIAKEDIAVERYELPREEALAWAKENIQASGLQDRPVRYIVDDVIKFVNREIRRGNKYDAIIMDPPSYGRGANGEVWKFEENLPELVNLCTQVLSDKPLFFLINSYTTGISSTVLQNILELTISKKYKGKVSNGEIGLPMTNSKMVLPCGIYGRWES